MNLEKSILDEHQAQIVVEVEAKRVQTARERAARKLASRGKIPGFRPGKAPFDVIVRYYGDAAVQEQAIDLLVDEVYPEMLKEAGIEPAAAGTLEKVEGEETPKLTFRVPLQPEVALGKYRDVRLPYEFKAPDAKRLDEALGELRQVYATTETVDRAAALGDYVVVDIHSPEKALERADAAFLIREPAPAEEFPFPGFSKELIGLKAGESKSVHHDYPSDAGFAALAGKGADVEVTVKTVRNVTLPDLDDDFAIMVGKYDNLDALKKALTEEIEARARSEYEDTYFADLVDKLHEKAVIKYAPQTLEHEAEHVVKDMGRRLGQQGLDLEAYYKMRNTDAARFLEEEAKPVARKRLERSLILDEVARVEKIQVENDELDEEFNHTLLDLQGRGLNLSGIRGGKQGQQRVAEAVAVESASRLLTRRTLERLKAIAIGESPAILEGAQPADSKAGGATGKASKTKGTRKPNAGAAAKPAPRKARSTK